MSLACTAATCRPSSGQICKPNSTRRTRNGRASAASHAAGSCRNTIDHKCSLAFSGGHTIRRR
jgi:hypothetical protein